MRSPLLLAGALLLTGCTSSGFALRKASCDVDVAGLDRDLTYHLLQGDGSGTFDYDPAGDALDGVQGSYDLAGGDFAWTETGSAESYVDAVEVTGFGYANTNGDLDIIGTREATDVLGTVRESQFRIERVGCEVEKRARYVAGGEDRERVEQGTYTSGGYEYSSTVGINGYAYTIEGERSSDGTYTEVIRYNAPDYQRDAEQFGDRYEDTYTFSYEDSYVSDSVGPVTRTGTDVHFTNGTQDREIVVEYSGGRQEWTYRIDYAGDGSGKLVINGTTCTLTYTAFQCQYTCNGQRRDC
jgi:hypothetical protein